MPLDYNHPPSAYYQPYISYAEPEEYQYEDEYIEQNPNTNNLPTPNLSGSASVSTPVLNPQAIWGPIKARLIPDTKRTLASILSSNISNLSEEEYNQLRNLIEYIATNPASKARVFDLTGFNDGDLQMAEKYFSKYKSRKFFSKLVNIALSTSSDGKVSKQVGGLLQFIFETGEVNGQLVGDDYKYKLMANIPSLASEIWARVATDCAAGSGAGLCSDQYREFLDLTADGKIDRADIDAAQSSLQWLHNQGVI